MMVEIIKSVIKVALAEADRSAVALIGKEDTCPFFIFFCSSLSIRQ
jgi:hypothetical protein